MKGFTKTLIALAALLALGGGARAQDGDHDGCSDTTLRGDYGFTISGQITGGPSPGSTVSP